MGIVGVAVAVLALVFAMTITDALSETRGGPGIDVLGLRFHVKVEDLPEPYATPSVANSARRTVKPSAATLQVPEGFRVNLFAGELDHARWMTVADNGDVLLAEPGPGKITILRDADGDGDADINQVFLRGLNRPHGLAIHDGHLYIGGPRRIIRAAYRVGDLEPSGKKEVVSGRGSLGQGGGHWTRNIVFAPGRRTFYVAVGSEGNTNPEAPPGNSTALQCGRQWPNHFRDRSEKPGRD